jgi:hypothetical protein
MGLDGVSFAADGVKTIPEVLLRKSMADWSPRELWLMRAGFALVGMALFNGLSAVTWMVGRLSTRWFLLFALVGFIYGAGLFGLSLKVLKRPS